MATGRSRLISGIAWGIAVLVTLAPTLGILRVGARELGGTPIEVLSALLFVAVGPVYAATGALIVSRRSRNQVGWLLLALGVGLSVGILSDVLVPAEPPQEMSPGLLALLAVSSVSWIFFIFPIFHLLLVFPTGRVVSPRWRFLVWLELAMVGFMLFSAVFGERIVSIDESWSVENPIGFVPEAAFGGVFSTVWNLLLLLLTISGLVAIVLRYRRARGIERQQMKWFLYAVALFALIYGGAAVLPGAEDATALDVLLPLAMMGLGVAVAVALLRYRLYEIDRIISRTVTYALVVGLLVGAVAILAAMVGTRSEDPLVVAATTLGVAALFNPLRVRIQKLVDRRFNRPRYDAERVMDGFARSLRDVIDPVAVVEGWKGVVAETMEPTMVGVWVSDNR